MTSPCNLYELLAQVADIRPKLEVGWLKGITVFSYGHAHGVAQPIVSVPYAYLFHQAQSSTTLVHRIKGITADSVVLLHLNSHLDVIKWFWTVVVAGYLPVISTPFVNDLEQRKTHILHLQTLLHNPVIITTMDLLQEFDGIGALNIHTIEELLANSRLGVVTPTVYDKGPSKQEDDLAVLALTSGSTGKAKAVCLRHGQILTAIRAKSEYHETGSDDTFLNWIGLDNVAGLTEIHLQAMYLNASQVHVQAADLLEDPLIFFRMINQNKIAYTFVPSFYLAGLRRALEEFAGSRSDAAKYLDLSYLRALVCGGEACVVETCKAISDLLVRFGAAKHVIRPGFGMTETCAGSIYSKSCPTYDLYNELRVTSLGRCVPGIDMRVMAENGMTAARGEVGNLQVTGPIVFKEYYHNPKATAEAFTPDGWFITGDQAFIDESRCLNIAGRAKESIITNGVKHFPGELEGVVEHASIEGVASSYTVVFPHRLEGSQSEEICIVYLPTYHPADEGARVVATDGISQIILSHCGVLPYKVIPLNKQLLLKSSLGKISRTKIRVAFESGEYRSYQQANDQAIEAYRTRGEDPLNKAEEIIMNTCCDLLGAPNSKFEVNTSLLQLGITSIQIIQLKQELQRKFDLKIEIPVLTILTNPSIRDLAAALNYLDSAPKYNPAVILQSQGAETPLWLIHSEVGEVLAFLDLAKYITDRPVYALRAQGTEGDEDFFRDIPDAVNVYHAAIKNLQPEGPYAIAGFSYGAILAVEVAKALEAGGDVIPFLGVFNPPPCVGTQIRQLEWTETILELSYFLGLITESYAREISPKLQYLSQEEVSEFIIEHSERKRVGELAFDKKKLARWADLAHAFYTMAREYEPTGTVDSIDVFYAAPPPAVSEDKEGWISDHLYKWGECARSEPRFHAADGTLHTMVGPDHVFSFQQKLKAVLHERGL